MGTVVQNPPDTSFGLSEEAIAALKAQYVARFGTTRGTPCCSARCCCLATVRVTSWPVVVGEEQPIYCPSCAAWMKNIMETGFGIAYREESIPCPTDARRAIAVGDDI